MITKKLARHSDKSFDITDDNQAKTLLLEIGIINEFNRCRRPEGFVGEWVSVVGYPDHATHWIIGFHYSGRPNASENGYGALCLPKCLVTSEQVERQIREAYGQSIESPLFQHYKTPILKKEN